VLQPKIPVHVLVEIVCVESSHVIRPSFRCGGYYHWAIGSGLIVVWPNKRWLGWMFIAIGTLIALLVAVWTVAVWHAKTLGEHTRPRTIPVATEVPPQTPITNSPVFAPVFAPTFSSQKEIQESELVTEVKRVPPEVECVDCYFVNAALSPSGKLVAQAVRHVKWPKQTPI
jgi:hypothetical protein